MMMIPMESVKSKVVRYMSLKENPLGPKGAGAFCWGLSKSKSIVYLDLSVRRPFFLHALKIF